MGSNLRVIAFKNQPDLATLDRIEWLTGFRLFNRRAAQEWYLEGPSPDPKTADLAMPLTVDYNKFPPSAGEGARASKNIDSFLIEKGLRTYGFDSHGLNEALALSVALDTSALFVWGNDEGVDSGYAVDRGRLVRARVMVDSETTLDIDGAALQLVAAGQEHYADANHIAVLYFAWPDGRRVSSDPDEIDPSEFELIASKGVATEFRPPGQDVRDQLRAIENGEGSSVSKLRQYIKVVDGYVNAALKRELPKEERAVRDAAEHNVLACTAQSFYGIYKARPRLHDEINRFLNDMGPYFRALRPKLEYRRKDFDFDGVRRRLKWRWRMLKLACALVRLRR